MIGEDLQVVANSAPVVWQWHPEVWLLVVAVLGIGFYTTRVIAPKVVAAGGEPVTTAQRRWFVAGVVVLYLSSDWPMHDIAEEYLYSIHMVQHLLLTYVMPPLFLLATPTWRAELILGGGRFGRFFRGLSRPLLAGLTFNVLVALSHAAPIVNTSVEVGIVHYLVHAALVLASFAMWMPVAGPLPELRIGIPQQIVYLFLMSVLPTVPAAFLTVADNPLYQAYNHEHRLWDVNVRSDQQAAGLIMKLAGGFYLWGIITARFLTLARRTMTDRRESAVRVTTTTGTLTFDDVTRAFDETPAVDDVNRGAPS